MMVQKKTSIFVLLIISLFCLSVQQIKAQQRRVPQREIADTIPFFRGVAVGIDVVGPAMRAFAGYGQYEALLRVNIKDRFYPVVELGVGQSNNYQITTETTFKTSAPYLRLGMDLNMLKNKHDDYRFLLGGRIAYTTFKYDILSPGVEDPIWGGRANYGSTGIKGNQLWAEFVAGIDAKIWGHLRMGWTVRYKARFAQGSGEEGEAWYVPGYGKGGSTRLGATFNVMFEL